MIINKIIGHGDIAEALRDVGDRELTFFASGVSNSQEKRESEYEREEMLLQDQYGFEHLVYFSSLSIFYADTRYTQHKRKMEKYVKEHFSRYTIVRLGNITWGHNPHTFLNYMKAHPEAPVKDEYKYMLEKGEFLHWMRMIPQWSCEMNITGKMMTVREALKTYGNT